MRMSEQFNEIAKALVSFKKEVESPKKTAQNPAFKREGKAMKYADLDAIIKTVDPVLAKHGLVQQQFAKTDLEDRTVSVTTILLHESGQFIESDPMEMPAENRGAFSPQAIGSAITYARRYSLSAILGIASEDDDDGNVVSLPQQEDGNQRQQQRPQQRQQQREQQQQRKRDPEVPTQTANDINTEIKSLTNQLKKMGGNTKQIMDMYLESRNLPNFDTFSKTDYLAYLKDIQETMQQKEEPQQSELLKERTTSPINWGAK